MNKKSNDREKIIIRTSIIGIIANFFLAGFKAFVGLISNSIAITLDAVNNLSDALSSIITIVGTKLAGKAPDKKHPYGHGRVEYISAMIISAIILYAGFTSLIESAKKIMVGETPKYDEISLLIIMVAVIVKIILGLYVKKTGKKVNSESLIDSGKDALMDAIISLATLVSAFIYIFKEISIEAWLAAIISIVIIKSGIEMLRSTISQILGERVDKDFAKDIKNTVCLRKGVHGAFDLVLNNYGPYTYMGSIHIEVDDTMTAAEIDELTRKIMKDVYEKHNVILAAIGIYSLNTKDMETVAIRREINKIVHSYKNVLQMHGFYLNKKEKTISFDIIIDFVEENKEKIYADIYDEIQKKYPEYKLNITLDLDVSD